MDSTALTSDENAVDSKVNAKGINVPLPELEAEVAQLMVSALNLEVKASEIDPVGNLYGDGLGLDSIDILELALAVSKKYGFQMRSDDAKNIEIFTSVRSLSQHIAQERTL